MSAMYLYQKFRVCMAIILAPFGTGGFPKDGSQHNELCLLKIPFACHIDINCEPTKECLISTDLSDEVAILCGKAKCT